MTVPKASETTPLLDDTTASPIKTLSPSASKHSSPQTSYYNTLSTPRLVEESSLVKTNDNEETTTTTTWKTEVKLLAKNASPLVLTYLSQYSYTIVMIYIAGMLGTKEQGAASIATMTANITGICIYEGLVTSLDTLNSQAYGAGHKKLVGIYLQRMCALMLLATIPIGILWISSPWILRVLIPEAEIAQMAGVYLRYYLLGAPGYGFFEAGKRFTQAQGNFTASFVAVMICAPLNLVWNWLFVFKFGLGFKGTALAMAFSNTLQPLVLLLYINLFARHTLECWPGFCYKVCFENLGPMIRLSIPGILMVLSEFLAFEILTFSSSYLETEDLAAQAVLMSLIIIVWHISNSVAIAASTRFGNLIGKGDLPGAKRLWPIYYTLFVGIGMFTTLILISTRHVVANNFTKDDKVREKIIATIPLVAAAEMFDSMSCIVNGLLRGLGRQRVGGWLNLGVYYGWATPLSLLLTFGPPKLGLRGLWVGPLSGLGLITIIGSVYLKCSDWQLAIDEAKARGEDHDK